MSVDFDVAMASGRFAVVLGSAGVNKTSGYILELLRWAIPKNKRVVVVASSGSAVCQVVAVCKRFLLETDFKRVRVVGTFALDAASKSQTLHSLVQSRMEEDNCVGKWGDKIRRLHEAVQEGVTLKQQAWASAAAAPSMGASPALPPQIPLECQKRIVAEHVAVSTYREWIEEEARERRRAVVVETLVVIGTCGAFMRDDAISAHNLLSPIEHVILDDAVLAPLQHADTVLRCLKGCLAPDVRVHWVSDPCQTVPPKSRLWKEVQHLQGNEGAQSALMYVLKQMGVMSPETVDETLRLLNHRQQGERLRRKAWLHSKLSGLILDWPPWVVEQYMTVRSVHIRS